jgi:hypothetical protein
MISRLWPIGEDKRLWNRVTCVGRTIEFHYLAFGLYTFRLNH